MSDDGDRRRKREPEFPLMFEPVKPSLAERMLSPLRDLFGSGDEAGPEPEGDPVRGGDRADGSATATSSDAAEPDSGPGLAASGARSRDAPANPRTGASTRADERPGAGTPARPADGERPGLSDPVPRATIQLLPGRLEPLDPRVVRQEVRFLRGPGPDSAVTLGWEVGEPPAHVTLDHPSIQPRHARMRFRDGEWTIESLSDEDLVEVNGEPLPLDDWPRSLRNGDLIRIGEAVFRFHQP